MQLDGAANDLIFKFILRGILPGVLLAVITIAAAQLIICKTPQKRSQVCGIISIGSIILMTVSAILMWRGLDIGGYIGNKSVSSSFVEDHYVDPKNVQLSFPEKPRNLIYIYLESMETTFADEVNGGDFPENLIPGLTLIAHENEDFSGESSMLNGAYSMPNTRWTVAAMFAEMSGLPVPSKKTLKSGEYLPGVTLLGDILSERDYHQVFMCGSNVRFGDRKELLSTHGRYDLLDYNYAVNTGRIPQDYKVWWGYEDAKLFRFAKEELNELAGDDRPFNLSLLTVDTHMEDGYVCQLCGNDFDDRYANVFVCSDRLVSEFVSWCQNQDWYENTTIVISGDHPTMDGDFCDGVSSEYTRKVYTAYINSAVNAESPSLRRDFTTFDAFPTTLASLGVKIEGERLGLGTNLFSVIPTLTEEYGIDEMDRELQKKSEFMDALAEDYLNAEDSLLQIVANGSINSDTHTYYMAAQNCSGEELECIYAEYCRAGAKEPTIKEFEYLKNDLYDLIIDLDEIDIDNVDISVYARRKNGDTALIQKITGSLYLKVNNLDTYLNRLKDLDTGRYTIRIDDKENAAKEMLPAQAAALQDLVVRPQSDELPPEINSTDYVHKIDGINFIVYDNELNIIADSVIFDLDNALIEREGFITAISTF
ncbi:MAG: LTA synthase family protein [Eubacteriales bacterium]|nr:LTA synthase family protein [Eubacteriales bacterium]